MKGLQPKPPHIRVLERTRVVGECWIFQGADNGNGYGVVGVGSLADGTRGVDYAHRVVYKALVGPIPDGYQIDHVKTAGCSSLKCVRPLHLEAVTPQTNVLRGIRPAQLAEENRDPSRRRGSRRFR